MKGVLAGLFLILASSVLLLQPVGAQNNSSHWEKSTTLERLYEIDEASALYPPYCDIRPTYTKLVNPSEAPDLRSPTEKLKDTFRKEVPEHCQMFNGQGSFALKCLDNWSLERCEARYYQPDGHGNEFIGWSQQLGPTKWYDPAPNGTSVLYLERTTTSAQAYKVSIDKTIRNWGIATVDGIDVEWGPNADYPTKRDLYKLRYKNNQDFTAIKHAFSGNGRFLAVLNSEGLQKIDLVTFERTLIEAPVANPPLFLAISNDGNFVATTNVRNELKVFDVQGCKTTQEKNSWEKVFGHIGLRPGCKVAAELKSQIQPALTINSQTRRLYFNATGSSLQFSLKADPNPSDANYSEYKWHEYKITADEWEPTAQGYLAMGDSFSSGEGDTEGNTWYEPGTDEQGDEATFTGRNLCHLSRRSYPYLIATELGYLSTNLASPPQDGLFHSVACSGAKIHNVIGVVGEKHDDGGAADFAITDNQYRYDRFNSLLNWQSGATRQLSSLTGDYELEELKRLFDPEVITLGIGGNDVGFGDFLKACLLPGTCDYAKPDSDKSVRLAVMMAQNKDRLTKTYLQTKQAAPEARVYVHGYPQFIRGNGGTCNSGVGLDDKERALAEGAINYMNQIVKAAAQEAGVVYVNVENILEGGRLCDESPTEYFNGVTAGNDVDPGEGAKVGEFYLPEGLCIVKCIGAETFHPNPVGFQKYKQAIISQTNALTTAMPEPVHASTPLPSSYVFGESALQKVAAMNSAQDDEPRHEGGNIGIASTSDTTTRIRTQGLYPGSRAEVVVHSSPISLGYFVVDGNGALTADVIMPADLEDGYHEMHVVGLDTFGNKVDYYQSFVKNPDYPEEEKEVGQSCAATNASGVDSDGDGIDDGCDGKIAQNTDHTPKTNSASISVAAASVSDEQDLSSETVPIQQAASEDKNVLGSSSTLERHPQGLAQYQTANSQSPSTIWWLVAIAGIMVTIITYFGINKKEAP